MNALATYLQDERGRAAALAKAMRVSAGFVYQLASGMRPVPAERCAAIESATCGQLRRWHLRPADWHLIWPELVEIEGAPPVPQETTDQEVGSAA